MKKLLSMLLAVLLLASVGAAAFAEGGYDETFKENGFTLHYTEAFEDTKGVFFPYGGGYDPEAEVGAATFWYFAMPREELEAIMNKEDDEFTDADLELLRSKQGALLEVITLGGGRGIPELLEMVPDVQLSEDWLTEITRVDDVAYFTLELPEETEAYLQGIAPAYREEFLALREELMQVLKDGEYFEPVVEGAELLGTTLSFETTDVDGNVVKSEELFAEHALTMVNIWATWCGPCVGELAELSEMNERLAEKDAAVVGICMDGDAETEKCRALIQEHGVEYLNLMPYEGMLVNLGVRAFPTSFFVDREGTIVALPFVGAPADMAAYEEVIDGLLAGDEVPVPEADTQTANDAGCYRVIVADEEGKLIEGAVIQFCTDETCTMGKTDANGVAEFQAEEGVYTVHVLKLPEGYVLDTKEVLTDEVYSDVLFVVKKA